MKLTAKARYAVTAMLDVALHGADAPVPLAGMAERQGISRSYLEQLFTRMRQRGLVQSVRGPGGGYQLARSAERISVADVVAAVGEQVDATRCAGMQNCQDSDPCLTHHLWADLSEEIRRYLDRQSLAGVLRHRDALQVARRQDRKFDAARLGGARQEAVL